MTPRPSNFRDELRKQGLSKEDEYFYRRDREYFERKRRAGEEMTGRSAGRRAPYRQPAPPEPPDTFLKSVWKRFIGLISKGDTSWQP